MPELTKFQRAVAVVIRLLVTLLQAKGKLTAGELCATLDLPRAQFYRHIKTLEAAGVNIRPEKHGRSTYYRVADLVNTPQLGPTKDEAAALVLGRQALRPWDGSPQVERYDALLERWDIEVNDDDLDAPDEAQQARNALFGHALEQQRWVTFKYPTEDLEEVESATIKPEEMSIIEGQSYVYGFSARHGKKRLFKVCRAAELLEHAENFEAEVPPAERLNLFRETPFDGTERGVEVVLQGAAAVLAREHPLMRGQKEFEEPDNRLNVIVMAPGLPAALSWTLRWGAGAEAISPQVLREAVADELATALSRYQETEAWARIMTS